MKHTQFFGDFLESEVNLDPTRLKRLNDHVDAVQTFLSQNLEAYEKVERQGSYALRTIIKPVKDGQEYDADILLYMKYDNNKEPKDYISDLYKCLMSSGTYESKTHRRTRCVQLDYAGDFHLDIVPCIAWTDSTQSICNRKTNEFEQTDGTGYRDWFNERTRITHGNLKRVTRLLKYLRDHKGNFSVKSILLTTFIGNTVKNESDGEGFKSLPDALKAVSNRLDDFLQRNPNMPRIENPVLPGEDFTRHWNQDNYSNFRRLFNVYNDKINEAYDALEHDDSIDKWRELFGERFGKKRGKGSSANSAGPAAGGASIAVAPSKPYAR